MGRPMVFAHDYSADSSVIHIECKEFSNSTLSLGAQDFLSLSGKVVKKIYTH